MDFGICCGDCGDLGCFLWLFGIEWCECGDWEFILVCLDWDEVEVVVMVIFFGLGEDLEVGVVDFFFFWLRYWDEGWYVFMNYRVVFGFIISVSIFFGVGVFCFVFSGSWFF